VAQKVKVGWQYANHDVGLGVAEPGRLKGDGFPEDIGVAFEAPLPRGIRDQNRWRCSGALLIRGEVAPNQRCHTQRSKERARDPEPWNAVWPARGFEHEAGPDVISSHGAEGASTRPPIQEVPVRNRAAILTCREIRTSTEHCYETGWLRVRQGPDHRRIDEAEKGDAGSDPQCRHKDRRTRKPAISQELTDGEAKILEPMLDEVYVAHVATLLLPLFHAVECAYGRVASLIARQASRDAGFELPFEWSRNSSSRSRST
jgi:hypothetical protein